MHLYITAGTKLYYYRCCKNELVKMKPIYQKQNERMKAIKNESELVQMKAKMLLCSYDRPIFLLMYVLLDYFQQYPYAC